MAAEHPSTTTPTRRAMLAGAAALPVTAAAALATPHGADAELLRLCAAWHAACAEANRLMDLSEAATTPAEADRLWHAACAPAATTRAIRDRILSTPARTRVGFKAKGEVVAQHLENVDGEAMRLVRDLVSDALAMNGGPA